MSEEDRIINRRKFFRQGLRELLKPLAQAIEPLEQVSRHFEELERQFSPKALPAGDTYSYNPLPIPDPYWIRPPGALPEDQFRAICSKCGECAKACPAQAIRIDESGDQGNGFPYIDVDAMPCVVCDGLHCMTQCRTGALRYTVVEEINMGLASWNEYHCHRSNGDNCTICVDRCPLGEKAIKLTDGRIDVLNPGCIGCGVCQHECPSSPKSITVIPKSAIATD